MVTMDRRLWKVTLKADGGTFRHVIVSATDTDSAIDAACNVELAPKRSVVSVNEYEGE